MLPLNTMFVRPAGLFPAPGSPGTALCKQRMSSSVCLALVSRSRGPTGTCTTAKVLFLQVCLDRETPEGSEIWLRAPGITKDWKKKIYIHYSGSKLPSCDSVWAARTQGCHILSPLPISSLPLAAFNAQSLSINYNPEMKGFVLPAEDWHGADLSQVRVKLLKRKSRHCPHPFFALHLTDGFIHKSNSWLVY